MDPDDLDFEMMSKIFQNASRKFDAFFYWANSEAGSDPLSREETERIHKARKWQKYHKPREGYIDAGIVLKKSIMVTRAEYEELSPEEWKELQDWVEGMSNLVVEQLAPDDFNEYRLLRVLDNVPCITTLEKR